MKFIILYEQLLKTKRKKNGLNRGLEKDSSWMHHLYFPIILIQVPNPHLFISWAKPSRGSIKINFMDPNLLLLQ